MKTLTIVEVIAYTIMAIGLIGLLTSPEMANASSNNYGMGYDVLQVEQVPGNTTSYSNGATATEMCTVETRRDYRELNYGDVAHILDKLTYGEAQLIEDYFMTRNSCGAPVQVTKEYDVTTSCDMPNVCGDGVIAGGEECDGSYHCNDFCQIVVQKPVEIASPLAPVITNIEITPPTGASDDVSDYGDWFELIIPGANF